MQTFSLIAPRSRNDEANLRSDRDGKMTGSSLVGRVLAKRYKILERIDVDSFRAHDLALDQTVTVRQANLTSERNRDIWRKRVRRLASVRHPNFLNVLDLIRDGSRDLVVTERPLGHSIAEFLKESSFDLEDVVRLMPLTALDLAATFASRPNSISARLLFVETTRPQDEQVDPKRRPIFDWPPIVIKLDVWELVSPSKNLIWPFLSLRQQESSSTGWAVRQVAQLTYELLSAEKRKSCAVKRRFKPVNALGNAGNSILYDGLQRSSLFESSESFFHKLESEIRSGGGESRALPAPASNPREHSAASSRTNDIIRRFNRDADWLAALVLGAVVSAALVLAVLVQDRRPKAVDLTEKAVQAGGDLLLNANSAMVLKNVGLKGKESTGEITSGQASSADHPLTEISPKENPSSPIQAAASVPTPVFAITSELNHINAQTDRSASSPIIWQDSARVIRPKIHIVRYRYSVVLRTVDVKTRLIALWHQSLARSEKSHTWTAFSNSNKGERRKVGYTAETYH
jgi:hypothetical protein